MSLLLVFVASVAGAEPELSRIFARVDPAEREARAAQAIRLWPQDAPGARGAGMGDIPLLHPVPVTAATAPRGAVIVLPGGSYTHHSAGEAFPIAERFAEMGLAAFVLQYRLRPDYDPYVDALADVRRAVRVIRSRATELGVDPERIAVIGFSAGGHLAAQLSVGGDDGDPASDDPVERQGCRIRSAALFYPVIFALGQGNPRPERSFAALTDREGLHRRVDHQTPPTFMIVGYDDASVPYENCLVYAARLHEAGVRFELHVLGSGGHGGAVREARSGEWWPLLRHWFSDVGVFRPNE